MLFFQNFEWAKSNCIIIFTFLQDVTLHGKIPERFILGVSTPGPVFDPASRQCAQVLVDYFEV